MKRSGGWRYHQRNAIIQGLVWTALVLLARIPWHGGAAALMSAYTARFKAAAR